MNGLFLLNMINTLLVSLLYVLLASITAKTIGINITLNKENISDILIVFGLIPFVLSSLSIYLYSNRNFK